MNNKTSPSNLGAAASVRGSVVDIRFDAHLPAIFSLLHARGEIAIEVLTQLHATIVFTQGLMLVLAIGSKIEDGKQDPWTGLGMFLRG